MINFSSHAQLANAQFTTHFRKPLYQGYAYSLIPNTLMKLLAQEDRETLPIEAVGGEWIEPQVVALFLIDGFGWNFLEKYLFDFPFLSRFEKEGVISKISSQFPSTTSAHVTTLCTALEVGQTGIYEWFQYEPLVERMISPLRFSFAGDRQVNTLCSLGITLDTLLPFNTIYEALKQRNVESYVIQEETIIGSPYSQAMFKGAHLIGYRSFEDALKKGVKLCNTLHPHPLYLFFYFGDIDAAGHRYGIESKEFTNAVTHCFESLEKHFWQPLSSCKNRITTLITADHGMTSVNPRTTLYLNKKFPQLEGFLKTNQKAAPLVPAGSCRDFFMHVQEEHLESIHRFLCKELEGKADVFLVSQLIEEGFFGRLPPSGRFLERVGNLVILPYPQQSVWWYQKHRFEQNFYAAHGGLTVDELDSIFLYSQIN